MNRKLLKLINVSFTLKKSKKLFLINTEEQIFYTMIFKYKTTEKTQYSKTFSVFHLENQKFTDRLTLKINILLIQIKF